MVTVSQLEKKTPNHRKHLILSHFLTLNLQPNNLNDLKACFESLDMDVWLYMLQYSLIPSKLLLQYVTRQVLVHYPASIQYLNFELIQSEMNKVDITPLVWVQLHKCFNVEITDISGDLSPLVQYLSDQSQVDLSEKAQKTICTYYIAEKCIPPLSLYHHLSSIHLFPALNKQCLSAYHKNKLDCSLLVSPLIYASDLSDLERMLSFCNVLHKFNSKSLLELRSWSSDELSCLFKHGLPLPGDSFYSKALLDNVMALENKNLDYLFELSNYPIDLKPLLKEKSVATHPDLSMNILEFMSKLSAEDIATVPSSEQFTLANLNHYDSPQFLSILQKLTIKTTVSILSTIPLIPLMDNKVDQKVLENIQIALNWATTCKNPNGMALDDAAFGSTPLHIFFKRFITYLESNQNKTNKLQKILRSMKSLPVIESYAVGVNIVMEMTMVYMQMFNKLGVNWNCADANGHYPLCLLKDLELRQEQEFKSFLENKTCMNCRPVQHDHSKNCAICRDEMDAPQILPCGHEYCLGCITEWLTTQECCPYCRRKVTVAELHQ